MTAPLVRAENVSRSFAVAPGWLGRRAESRPCARSTSTVARGEAVGVVGEIGCGKTTLGRMLLHLLPPTSGRVFFDGRDSGRPARRRRAARLRAAHADDLPGSRMAASIRAGARAIRSPTAS